MPAIITKSQITKLDHYLWISIDAKIQSFGSLKTANSVTYVAPSLSPNFNIKKSTKKDAERLQKRLCD